MRNSKREVECLKRLQELSPVYDELLQFLDQEFLISKEELKVIKNSPEKSKLLQAKLALLSDERKLQLVEYIWQVLPVERISVTIVSERAMKEFAYGDT
jgi:hypothetical protein